VKSDKAKRNNEKMVNFQRKIDDKNEDFIRLDIISGKELLEDAKGYHLYSFNSFIGKSFMFLVTKQKSSKTAVAAISVSVNESVIPF
jgi:hypothetical protein